MFANMPLRHKMTLFYVVMTLVLMGIFLPVLYYVTHSVLLSNQEEILRLTHAQLGSDIEQEDGIMVLESTFDLTRISGFSIRFLDGRIIAQEGMPAWTETLLFEEGVIRTIQEEDESWLVLDGYDEEDDIRVSVRAIASLEQVEDTMRVILITSVILIPVLLIVAIPGGLIIARRSLRPIDHIITTTQVISNGDLSGRIEGIRTKDEVGQLSTMMNGMLDNVELAFKKEKRFASDASHELRTPTSIIMTYAEELLEDETTPFETKKSLQTILDESQHMERIISQLLMITRGDEKRYPVELEPLDIAEIVDSVVDQLAPQAQASYIHLHMEVQDGIQVQGDQSLVTQMMINLVENAIRYGKKDGNVWVSVCYGDNDRCVIRVTDDGIGIAAEHIPKLFDRFYRADTSRDRTGSGLGLSIVQWIVEIHEGKVSVDSTLDKGTTFTITI